MRRGNPVAPFRLAAAEGVNVGPWRLTDSGELLGEKIEHWDPDLTLRLDRRVAVDVDGVLAATGLASAEGLAFATSWRSDRTRLRRPGMSTPLRGHYGDAEITLAIDVPGQLAGGSVELRTALVLVGADGSEVAPTVARRLGSVLWSDVEAVALEGSAARFPVTILDFSGVPGLADAAPWTLEWSPHDLDQPVLGALRLLVNDAVPAAVAAVSGGQEGESAAIAGMIRFDVARALIHGALTEADFVRGDLEFEPDSVGRMLRDLLERYWGGVSAATLARRLAETPHRFESELQAKVGLLA